MSLWERTKSVAKMYTGTFIVIMILNQLLFFGFCLNPICLIAAMPHVLLITVFVGSWVNKEFGWGDEKQTGNFGEIYNEKKKRTDETLQEVVVRLKAIDEPASQRRHEKTCLDTRNIALENNFSETPKVKIDYTVCQTCGAKTVLRTAHVGKYAGRDFYGCSRFPACKGITNIEPEITRAEFDVDISL